MAELSSYWRKGRRAWEKYPICLGLPQCFLLFVALSLKVFVFLSLKQLLSRKNFAGGL